MINISGEIMENPGVKGLGGDLPGQAHFGIQGPPGPPGAPFTYADFTEEQLMALTGPHGKDGLSVYILNATLAEPEEEIYYYRFARSMILTNGREPQVGDLVISSNGILGVIYTFVEDDAADAVIRPMVKLSGEDGALRVDCVITSDLRPPFISTWGENANINFSVVSGSILDVWNKVNRGEQPNVLFRYLGETEGDVFNYFMEADYVEHFGYGSTPAMLRMNFIGNGEIITLASTNQSDITNNRITSYTVTEGMGKPGQNGTNGYSIFYMNEEVEYPADFQVSSTNKSNLSNNGTGVKIGDLLISINGVLCKVSNVGGNIVNFDPVAKISEEKDDIVTAVLNALPTWNGGSY